MTIRPLSLSFRTNEPANPHLADELTELTELAVLDGVLGSLPMTYRRTNRSETADVVAVGGPEWAAHATSAAASGASGILVTDPWPLESASLRGIVALRCPVVIDTAWRHNPAVDLIGEGVARYREPGAVLEIRSTTRPGSDLARAAVGLLDLVTAVATGLSALSTVRHDDRSLVLDGRLADGTVVMTTIVATNAQPINASLSISGHDGRAQLQLPDPSTAALATATVTDSTGHTVLPVGNESAHRGALKRLAAAVAGDVAPPDDPERFVAYAKLLLDAIDHQPVSRTTDRTSHDRGAL